MCTNNRLGSDSTPSDEAPDDDNEDNLDELRIYKRKVVDNLASYWLKLKPS